MQGIPFCEPGPFPAIVPPFSPLPESVVAEDDGVELPDVVLAVLAVLDVPGVVGTVPIVPPAIASPLSVPMKTCTAPALSESLAVGVTPPPSCAATAWAAAEAPLPYSTVVCWW